MSRDLPRKIGRYEVSRLLGRGNLGPVYLALDPILERQVAVKVLEIEDADLAREAVRAARAAAVLQHPNIVTVYEIGDHDGRPYIAMEYVQGGTLGEVIRRGDLSMDRRLELSQGLCEAVAYAHERGVLHTTIHPGEILLSRDGVVKVPLLGIARLMLRSSAETSGVIFGTAQYLSPEQVKGNEVDGRSDVFSVGLVLYELLTSAQAFSGPVHSVLLQILQSAPTPATQLNPEIGPALAAVIDTALNKEPSGRYQTMREFAKAMARIRSARKWDSSEATICMPPPGAPKRQEVAATPRRIDDNVQFSVYRPPAIEPARWYSMLVFTHLSSRRPGSAPDEPDPVEEVGRRAKALLGSRVHAPDARVPASSGIPEEGQLRVVPHVPGIEFNPPAHTFIWVHSIHQVEFSFRADAALQGRTARGSVEVYLGALTVGHIPLAVPVEVHVDAREQRVGQTVNSYRKLFASYSHRDEAIVRQFENYATGLGDRYLRDVLDLRAGEVWNARLRELIESADVFQLFWSRNAMDSVFVRQEWEHALTVGKPDFIRPVYWEVPFPKREGLPPIDLSRLHFAFVGEAASAPAAHAELPAAAVAAREADLRTEDTGRIERSRVIRDARPAPMPESLEVTPVAMRAPQAASAEPPRAASFGWSWFIIGGLLALIATWVGWC